jgi:superoxide dismutase, Cu-Zn family
MIIKSSLLAGALALAFLFSSGQAQMKQGKDMMKMPPAKLNIEKAAAVLNPTQGNQTHGIVTFTQFQNGIKIVADIEGLTPGKHGFHIHEYGDCSAGDGSSAGGHFNPEGKQHGMAASANSHMGDLGNIEADSSGKAHLELTDPMMTLSGPNSIIGRSVVVHAGFDDMTTQPTGNSGARVACGVIGIVK